MSDVQAAAPHLRGHTLARVGLAWAQAGALTRIVTIAAAGAAAVVAVWLPAGGPARWAVALTGGLLAIAALVDLREHRLPNWLLAVAFAVALAGSVSATGPRVLTAAVLGGVAAGGAMLVVRLARGVGMGDVKMAAVVGTSAGSCRFAAAPLAIAVAALVAAGYGLARGRQRLPLGPSLWAGWAVATVTVGAGWSA